MSKIILSMVLTAITFTNLAQSPQVFKYQTIVRDNAGEILANQPLSFRISIHQGSTSGIVIYQEIHSTTTNDFGLASLEIGNETPLIGIFSSIDWGSGDKFLEIELDTDNGNNYLSMGTSQLLSVPFALHSETTADAFWDKNGNNISYSGGNVGIGTNNPIEMLNIEGNVIANNLYASDSTLKTNKVYFTNSGNGLLIGDRFNNPLTKHNLLINTSYASGMRDVFTCQSLGNYNVALTVEGLGSNAFTGNDNVFIGHYTGYNLTNGSYNVFIGSSAGEHSNPNNAISIGTQAGDGNSGNRNVFIGQLAGYGSSGDDNIGLGKYALYQSDAVNGNNIAIGKEAGYDVDSPYNIFIGYQTGRDVELGNGKNIFIGYEVGDYYNSGVASDILLIDNAQKTNKDYFIAGDMSSDTIAFNADINIYGKLNVTENVGIGISNPGTYKLYVSGSAYATGNWQSFDKKFKKNIQSIENPVELLKKINGASYNWKIEKFAEKGFPEGKHYGLIAQEIEKVLPDIVREGAGWR